MRIKNVIFVTLGSILLSACGSQQLAKTPSNSQKPNIIYILADDLGYGDVGFNGQTKIKTPNLDLLASEGIVFKQHYSGTAVCGPSRAALLTGINTAHGHIRELPAWTASGKPIDLLAEEVTVAEELKRAGYKTAVLGKWAMEEGAGTGAANDQGFDYFYGYKTHIEAHHYYPEYLWENGVKVMQPQNNTAATTGTYSNDDFTDRALNFISANKDNPFFLYLPYTIPHNEITVPADSKEQYLDLGWPERKMNKGHYYHDPEGNTSYAGMVTRLDRYVGQIMQKLKEEGLDDNTLIIFTSDNGPGYDNGFFDSNGPFRGRKLQLYEGGIRSPFAARWPGVIKAGSVSQHQSAFWDFLPTACEIAGIKPTLKVDGISYLSALKGEENKQATHPFLYWEINENQGPVQAIRMGKWKGIKAYEKEFELYDLDSDISESNNLAAKYPEIVAKILQTMLDTRTENAEFPLTKRKGNYGD